MTDSCKVVISPTPSELRLLPIMINGPPHPCQRIRSVLEAWFRRGEEAGGLCQAGWREAAQFCHHDTENLADALMWLY